MTAITAVFAFRLIGHYTRHHHNTVDNRRASERTEERVVAVAIRPAPSRDIGPKPVIPSASDRRLPAAACAPQSKSQHPSGLHPCPQLSRRLPRRAGDAARPGGIRREHIEAWLGRRCDGAGRAPATVSVYYRSLQPFWKWAIEEGLVRECPMRHMRPPIVPEQPVPILTPMTLRALLEACEGRASRIAATGHHPRARRHRHPPRRAGGLAVGDVDHRREGGRRNGRRPRQGSTAADACRSEPRPRWPSSATSATASSHPKARRPMPSGSATAARSPATASCRCSSDAAERAGIDRIHPHHAPTHLRPPLASRPAASESDLMRLAGWRSARRCCAATRPQPPTSERERPKASALGDRL